MSDEELLREQLVELLWGGFAPNINLLREFDHSKAGVILEGLHFSAWILLGHIHERHKVFLKFLKQPSDEIDLWPKAPWPENYQPKNSGEWNKAIDNYETDLKEMVQIIKESPASVMEKQPNGRNFAWAAMTVLHHTGYHIGQLKTIGRQLGVW